MGLSQRQPFTSSGEFVARKAFTFNGKKFAPGADFPSGKDCDDRKLRQLYEGGFLRAKIKNSEEPKKPKKVA